MMNWYITFALVCTLRGLTCDVGSNTTTTQITTDDLSDVNGTYVRAELEKEFYLQSLFNKYGQNGVLKVSGLRQIFVNIGLTSTPVSHVHVGDKQDSAHLHSHDRNVINHVHQRSSDPLIYFKKREVQTHADEHGEKSNHVEHRECLGVDELLHVYHFRDNRSISHEDFVSLCPGLITLLDREICGSTNWIAIDSAAHEHRELADIPSSVWGYSSLAILVISLVGLLGVAVIPVMQKVFYNHLLQFLVALAVGALSGDALLHLIPHALAGEHEPHDETSEESMAEKLEEQKNVMKGLVGLTGIYAFFLIERIMTIATDLKRKRQEEKHRKKKLEYANELGEAEIKEVEAQLPVLHDHACHNDCGHMEFGIHPGNKALEQFAEEAHRDQYEEQVLEEKLQSMHSLDKIGISDSKKEKDEEIGHGHGHSHGHSHGQLPEGVAAIAWMVILGDGIHNFSDGLAIGAAFSNSITGGISTSIAVFCHELPHEIGDFAVLLKAGMKVNQAVMYNVVSSILAFVGMLIGVVIGNISEASVWIFAIVGGMFLYIALVDMLPQMMSVKTKDGENPFYHLLFQVGGMIVGIGIMLLIGLFEEDLKTMLE